VSLSNTCFVATETDEEEEPTNEKELTALLEGRRLYALEPEAYTFYVLSELKRRLLSSDDLYLPSFFRLYERVEAIRQVHLIYLSDLLSDYLTLIAYGEARHAWSNCKYVLRGLGKGHTREGAAVSMCKYEPVRTLKATTFLFRNVRWHRSSYGGYPWSRISEAAYNMRSGKWRAETFCDYSFDLSHNGGLCFDKGYLVTLHDKYSFKSFLDYKASRPLAHWPSVFVPWSIWRYVQRAHWLGLLTDEEAYKIKVYAPKEQYGPKNKNIPLLERPYYPIRFGEKNFGGFIPTGRYTDYRDEDEWDIVAEPKGYKLHEHNEDGNIDDNIGGFAGDTSEHISSKDWKFEKSREREYA
jgi:hypothetical protein